MMPEVTILQPFQSAAGSFESSSFSASSFSAYTSGSMNQAARSTAERFTAEITSQCSLASFTKARRAARLRFITLMAARRSSSVMVLPAIFSSSPFTCMYWSTVNCRPKAGLRFWG